jgi:hypothetical protein
MDPDTGEIVDSIGFDGIFSGITTDPETGEDVPWVAGPGFIDVDDTGVYAAVHLRPKIVHLDFDGNIIWINDNGDEFLEKIMWDHDNNPETPDEYIVNQQTGNAVVWDHGLVFSGVLNLGVNDDSCGLFLGPDGNGIGWLHIQGYLAYPGRTNYREVGGPYDGFYVAGAQTGGGEGSLGWVIYVPGRIREGSISSTVGVEEVENSRVPMSYALEQNYPNPFNPSTTIRFDLPEAGNVVLTVYNVAGQEVARLADESLGAGSYIVEWDGRDMNGQLVSSGVYLYKLKSGGYTDTKRMMLMK